jgi:cell shape-determining protein MreC
MRVGSILEPPTAMGGMMAAIFLVLAVADAALLANVALTNTSASSLSVFDQSVTGFTQGQLLLAAGLGLLLALFLRMAWSSSSARRAKRRELRAARREVEGRVAELERENARLRQELEGSRRAGALVGPRGASSEGP